MEFGKLTVDYPNAPARGAVAGNYATVAVAPFVVGAVEIPLPGGGSAKADLAGIRFTAQARRRLFGLPIGPRPRLGFPNLKAMLSFRDAESGADLVGDVRRGLFLDDDKGLVDLVHLEVGGQVCLVLAGQVEGGQDLIGLFSDAGADIADFGRRGALEVQIKLLSAGLPEHLAYLLDRSSGSPAIVAARPINQAFVAQTRRATPGYNRPT